MVDSTVVLNGQTLAYTCYCLAILLVMGWFGYKITRPGKNNKIANTLFYSFTGMLVVLGVSLHIVTFNTIPWAPMDLNRAEIKADKVFNITIEKHKFTLPEQTLNISCNEKVLFSVLSHDLTYGFGLFRPDNSMVFQMQVVPGHPNDILWQFEKPGTYTIRSTEYSGPTGWNIILKDAVIVTCNPTANN
ncbi:MAG: cytochrome C oxidase subunit II [Bacteroidetes bacterium]|nr:cytochrome C oxidase subunit II [Bacteroidota bacterium]